MVHRNVRKQVSPFKGYDPYAGYISLDTETTGLDMYHGSLPYMVTTCDMDGLQTYWEWNVDPLTREVAFDDDDLDEIKTYIHGTRGMVFQNCTFDIGIMDAIPDWEWEWDWSKVHDLLLSSHMLASCQRRDLTTLSLIYLDIDVQPFDDRVHEATEKCRRITRNVKFKADHGQWAIAENGRADMPSAKGDLWKGDMWLLRAMVQHAPVYLPSPWPHSPDGAQHASKAVWEAGEPVEDHPFTYLLEEYGNSDSAVTLPIHVAQMQELAAWG